MTPSELLRNAAQHIEDRASKRDCPDGERSMSRTVTAFNAMEGTELTEEQGWRFMVLLKYARATAGSFVLDDYEDMAAYAALAAETGYGEEPSSVRRAPWPDIMGTELFEGDRIVHPNDQIGVVVYDKNETTERGKWKVDYDGTVQLLMNIIKSDSGIKYV